MWGHVLIVVLLKSYMKIAEGNQGVIKLTALIQ
jgi:hypothetical protein